MKIWIGNESTQSIGGGWTFARNFRKGMTKLGVTFVDHWHDADTVFIAGATQLTKETLNAVKAAGKRIILRVDNIPRNSANRNCGTSRLKACADAADLVIYQSEWARTLLTRFVGKEGLVVYNGADTDLFRPPTSAPRPHTFIYSRFGRNETKGWEMAWFAFQNYAAIWPDAELTIVGKFSPEQVEYGFDFFQGEKVKYLGVIEDPTAWAAILRQHRVLSAPYAADACSNTIIEARLCGLEIDTLGIASLPYPLNGGTPEVLNLPIENLTLDHMCSRYWDIMKTL